MKRIDNVDFKPGTRVVLDDTEFVDCTFTDCMFVYSGTEFSFVRSTPAGAFNITFEGAAQVTIEFLRALAAMPGGREFVIAMLTSEETAYGTG